MNYTWHFSIQILCQALKLINPTTWGTSNHMNMIICQ